MHEEHTTDPAQQASVLMKRGIALLNEGSPEQVAESLQYFEEALALRRALPPSEDPWASHVLAASWMNRGDALTRLGTPEHLAEALRSYDEALAVLGRIPLDANPLFRRRFAIAWMNRGITLLEQATPAALEEAARSFERGIAALAGVSEEVVIVACGWMNRANALFRCEPPRLAEAQQSAATAMSLLAGKESGDLVAAESGLKARHIFCQAVAELVSAKDGDAGVWIASAMNAVESGLEVARVWEQRGETQFRPLVSGLFRFGTVLCQRHQPESLAGFLRHNVGIVGTQEPGPESIEMHLAAVEALAQAWRELQKEGFAAINTPRLDHWLEVLRTWRITHGRLRELHAQVSARKDEVKDRF